MAVMQWLFEENNLHEHIKQGHYCPLTPAEGIHSLLNTSSK